MGIFDRGSGRPIVVVQPLQGRWEWTKPVLRALSRHARVISYSLSGDLGSGRRLNAARGFEEFVGQLEDVMNEAGVKEAALCGISYGGAIAAHFAAVRPERVTALVLASSPGPGWQPNPTQAAYVARPWLSMPAFTAGALGRVGPEIIESLPTWPARIGFTVRYAASAIRYPMMPHLMARRVRLMAQLDLATDCSRIGAPTLVITGEPSLDRVVPVSSTRRYAELIPDARYAQLPHTGHLGVLTQPERFATLVSDFINADHS